MDSELLAKCPPNEILDKSRIAHGYEKPGMVTWLSLTASFCRMVNQGNWSISLSLR
jgi:hypothetical protein